MVSACAVLTDMEVGEFKRPLCDPAATAATAQSFPSVLPAHQHGRGVSALCFRSIRSEMRSHDASTTGYYVPARGADRDGGGDRARGGRMQACGDRHVRRTDGLRD